MPEGSPTPAIYPWISIDNPPVWLRLWGISPGTLLGLALLAPLPDVGPKYSEYGCDEGQQYVKYAHALLMRPKSKSGQALPQRVDSSESPLVNCLKVLGAIDLYGV